MDDVIVRLIDLPYKVKGMTVKDNEGDFNIYINGRLDTESQKDAFLHEIEHIKSGHFYSEGSVYLKEKIAVAQTY